MMALISAGLGFGPESWRERHRGFQGRRGLTVRAADGFGKAPERRLGKADFIGATKPSSVIKSVASNTFDCAQFDPREAAEDVRPQRARMPRNHDHVFAAGVQIDAWDLELRALRQRRQGGHDYGRSWEKRAP